MSLSRRDVLWQLSLVALAPRFALGGVSAEPSLSFPQAAARPASCYFVALSKLH